jgi:bifunctional ADP-heptose synthase (sugar kinase/adenylyltransferase)
MIAHDRLETVLTSLPRLTIGLVGDLFLDRYLEIEPVHELSIETGLEAYQVSQVRNSPGALGTVLNNLATLGVGLLVPVTVIGDDGHGYDLLKEVKKLPVDPSQIICSPRRLTPAHGASSTAWTCERGRSCRTMRRGCSASGSRRCFTRPTA